MRFLLAEGGAGTSTLIDIKKNLKQKVGEGHVREEVSIKNLTKTVSWTTHIENLLVAAISSIFDNRLTRINLNLSNPNPISLSLILNLNLNLDHRPTPLSELFLDQTLLPLQQLPMLRLSALIPTLCFGHPLCPSHLHPRHHLLHRLPRRLPHHRLPHHLPHRLLLM